MPLFKSIQANRPRNLESFKAALIFAVQAAVCAIVLLYGFQFINAAGRMWALISAVLALQPGIDQSLTASLTRIIANILGAAVGAFIGLSIGYSPLAVVIAFIMIIFICEYLRLDLGMRTACVSVVIVLVKGENSTLHYGIERVIGVIIGCAFAIALQLVTEKLIWPLVYSSTKTEAVLTKKE